MPDLERIKKFKDRVADTATSVADSAQGTLQKTSEKVTDTASSVAGAVQDASQKASVEATDAAASAVWSAQDALQEASEKVTDTAASVAGSAQDTLQKTSEKVTDTASSATGALQDASQKASVKATDAAASAVWSAQDALQEASEKVTGATATVTGSVQDAAPKVPDVATSATEGMKSGAKGAFEATADAVQGATQKASDVAIAAVEGVKTGPKTILAATTSAANVLLSTTQGLLASDLSGAVNVLLQDMVKGAPTIYDKAMDAEYLATHVGGGYHRLFDGGHTIIGAFNAVRGASSDDNIVQEALGTAQGLLRDVSTPRGLPLATWDKETFDRVAGTLESSFHIPKSWFYDLNTFTAAELLGGTIGAVVMIFSWNRADTETFARFVGSMGVSSALSANPLLLIVTVVALARAFQKAHRTGEYAEFVDGQLKGGIVSGATLAAVSLVGVAGGPAGAALLVALVTGILVNKATENVSIVQIGQVVARQAVAAATEAKSMIAQQIPAIP